MSSLFGFLLFSFAVNAALIVPFINLLYKLKFQKNSRKSTDVLGALTPVFNALHLSKVGTPIGGGLLIIVTTSILYLIVLSLLKLMGATITSVYPLEQEIKVIFTTFILFGLLGLYDDIIKFFGVKTKGVGLSAREKFIIQIILSAGIAWYLYYQMGIHFINVPYFGVVEMGLLFIPFATFTITAFANAVNITDGLDGLASGLLMIALLALVVLSLSILDTPITLFLSLWLGGLIAFLYFNTYPARIMLGDVGSLAFGATLAVIGLLLGKVIAITVVGGLFVIEITSSLLQILSKRFFHRRIFPVSPAHLWLQKIGWHEAKIVARAWLAAIILAIFGLWLAFL